MSGILRQGGPETDRIEARPRCALSSSAIGIVYLLAQGSILEYGVMRMAREAVAD